MAVFTVPNISISGMAACVPRNTVSNHDFDILNEKERDLLIKTIGIENRRVAAAGTTSADLCQIAAERLLKEIGWQPSTVQLLVFVTQTPDYITPATATLLQNELGLPKTALAFDINLGCSGYVYGLSVVASLLSRMPGVRALLLVGDIATATISDRDKSTTPIFSDAGSATALEYDAKATTMTFNMGSDGAGSDAIIIPHGGYRHPVDAASLQYRDVEPGITRNDTHLIMNGIDVFNFALKEVTANVNELLEKIEVDRQSIDYYLFHQAQFVQIVLNYSMISLLILHQQPPYFYHEYFFPY